MLLLSCVPDAGPVGGRNFRFYIHVHVHVVHALACMYYRKYMHMCKCAGLDPRTARVSVTAAAARVEAAEARRGLVSTVEGRRPVHGIVSPPFFRRNLDLIAI